MPALRLALSLRRAAALASAATVAGAAGLASSGAFAQAPSQPQPESPTPAPMLADKVAPPTTGPEVINSNLDARLFYELLLGEITLREGDAGSAYQLLLDAARKSRNEGLFKRATDIALQARAGEQALAAAVAWRQALPESQDALRYQVQLYVALNRVAEAEEPLGALLRASPKPALPAMIEAVPRFLGRSGDRAATAALVERALQPFASAPETRSAALVSIGRAALAAGNTEKALDSARQAAAASPESDAPALLALDMLPATPAAEAVVKARLAAAPANPAVRLLYIRTLAASQRLGEAAEQATVLTKTQPDLAPPWLTLGALELELKHPKEATTALLAYVKLIENGAAVGVGPAAVVTDEDDDTPSTPSNALTQAWLLLAQAAEQQRDFPGAERWLAKIDNPQRALEVQSRRASLLAKQGKLAEARALIRRAPEQTSTDSRAKLLAEVELLRENKQWAEASKLLGEANQRWPDDTDLIYEQAMAEEKLDRVDDMERLLRRVIALKPTHQHAYNALGYSLAERKVRLPEARELIKKALELSPGEPFITDSLGWVEYRLGNREEAIRLLRTAYQARPDVEIAAHLGEVLWASGLTDEARQVWREGRSRDSSNDTLKKTLARLRVDL